MKRLLLLTALAVVTVVSAFAADEKRDGERFNQPASCRRYFVTRTVDSTGTAAGRKDSAVVICPPQELPVPVLVGGVDYTDTSSAALRIDGGTGGLYLYDPSRDRNLDFNVTNLLVSAAMDTGGSLGANVRYSAPVDVRQYGKGSINIIVQCLPAAADTTVASGYWYDLAVAVFPLPYATTDWGGTSLLTAKYGVPYVPILPPLVSTGGTVGVVIDSVGSFGTILAPNAANLGPGERRIRFSATRPANVNFNNTTVFQTITLPASWWLGEVRPRYLVVQARLIQKAAGATGTPLVKVDMEALR